MMLVRPKDDLLHLSRVAGVDDCRSNKLLIVQNMH